MNEQNGAMGLPLPLGLAQRSAKCRLCGISFFGEGLPKGWAYEFAAIIFPVHVILNFGEECAHAECLKMQNRDKVTFNFPSSGNEEQDEAEAQRIARTESRLADNVCPNGCATMDFIDDYNRVCPICHFSQHSNAKLR